MTWSEPGQIFQTVCVTLVERKEKKNSRHEERYVNIEKLI